MRQPTICAKGTSFSTVFQLRAWMPATVGCVMWIAMGRPDATAYVPWYAGLRRIPAGLSTGDPTTALAQHFDPKLKAKGSPTNFAAVQDFERRLEPHYGKFYRYLDGNRDAFESLQWKTQIKVEQTAERIHRKDPDAARQYLTTWSIRQQATVDLLVRDWSVRLEDVANGVIRNGR